MAVRWPELAKECDKIDLHMKGYGFPKYLKLKVYAICIMLTILRLCKFYNIIIIIMSNLWTIAVVYSLFDVTMSTSARIEAHTFIDVGRAAVVFFKQNASFMDGCKMLLVILKHLSHWRVVMLRCYVDVFIITTSVILTVRNHQLGERVELLIQARVKKFRLEHNDLYKCKQPYLIFSDSRCKHLETNKRRLSTTFHILQEIGLRIRIFNTVLICL